MARKTHHIATPVPILALGREDALAYYTKPSAAGCTLRDIDPIEQMYGYYNVDRIRRSAPFLPVLN